MRGLSQLAAAQTSSTSYRFRKRRALCQAEEWCLHSLPQLLFADTDAVFASWLQITAAPWTPRMHEQQLYHFVKYM